MLKKNYLCLTVLEKKNNNDDEFGSFGNPLSPLFGVLLQPPRYQLTNVFKVSCYGAIQPAQTARWKTPVPFPFRNAAYNISLMTSLASYSSFCRTATADACSCLFFLFFCIPFFHIYKSKSSITRDGVGKTTRKEHQEYQPTPLARKRERGVHRHDQESFAALPRKKIHDGTGKKKIY